MIIALFLGRMTRTRVHLHKGQLLYMCFMKEKVQSMHLKHNQSLNNP
jgi:hypothetical protein